MPSNGSSGHFNDEYELKEELGKGAFSIVRRCVKVTYPDRLKFIRLVDFPTIFRKFKFWNQNSEIKWGRIRCENYQHAKTFCARPSKTGTRGANLQAAQPREYRETARLALGRQLPLPRFRFVSQAGIDTVYRVDALIGSHCQNVTVGSQFFKKIKWKASVTVVLQSIIQSDWWRAFRRYRRARVLLRIRCQVKNQQ